MPSSPYTTKPQHATELNSPLAKATKKLLHSLDALLTVLTTLSKERFPSEFYIADVADGSIHSLTSGLQTLSAYIQKSQRTPSSRIDEEIDASYSLEMNYSVSSFRQTLLSAPHNTLGNTTKTCIQDFTEIVVIWTKHYQIPRFQRWKGWKDKVSSLARRGSSRTRQISLLESKFTSERTPIPVSDSYPGSMVSPIYALDDYLEWSTPMSPFDRTATAIGPCRAVYLYQRKRTLSRHEYLVFGFGVETPTNWCRVDRIASLGQGHHALTQSSSPELICFASSKSALVSPDSEELGAIIVDLPKDRSGLIFIGECNRYMRQSVFDFPETTLFSANITYFARCTMISLVIIFTRLEKRHANDRTTILCWGNQWDTRLPLVLQACRADSRPKFFLDYRSKILAKGEALLHRSFLRDYHEQDECIMIRVLNQSVMILYHLTVNGPEHLQRSANALMARGYAAVAYRHYLLGEWEDACEFGRRCLVTVPWAREPPDASMPFDALEREAFGGVLIGSHVAALAFIRLKNFEQALLTARNAEPLARFMSNDGSPSSRWTLVYGALRGSVARGLVKDPRGGAKEGLATSREAEDLIRKMHKVHPAMSTATHLVLQIINLGTVLFESKELVSAFDQAEAAMQILRQNKLRDPHHLAVATWALSCHGQWSTAVGRMAEAVNGNQETMVHIWWVPAKHRQRLTQIHVPVLDTLLLRRRTYDILENFGDPWPLGDYYKTTDCARDCFKISPVHNGFLLGDCLTSQAWAVFNKDPDHPEKAVKLELEALQRFDWYKDYQHPRAHFQAIRSLCMLTLYHACAGDLGEAANACENALERTRQANYTLRRAILVEAAGWADEHGLRLIKQGRVEDGARLKGSAWKLRGLLLEMCVANGEDDDVFSGGFRQPTRGVQDDRMDDVPEPDIAQVTPLPPSPVPSKDSDSHITPIDDDGGGGGGNTVSEGSSTPTAVTRPRSVVSACQEGNTLAQS